MMGFLTLVFSPKRSKTTRFSHAKNVFFLAICELFAWPALKKTSHVPLPQLCRFLFLKKIFFRKSLCVSVLFDLKLLYYIQTVSTIYFLIYKNKKIFSAFWWYVCCNCTSVPRPYFSLLFISFFYKIACHFVQS